MQNYNHYKFAYLHAHRSSKASVWNHGPVEVHGSFAVVFHKIKIFIFNILYRTFVFNRISVSGWYYIITVQMQWRFWTSSYEACEFQIRLFYGLEFQQTKFNYLCLLLLTDFEQEIQIIFSFCRETSFSDVLSLYLLKNLTFSLLSLSSHVTLTLEMPLLTSENTCDFAAVSGVVFCFWFFFFFFFLLWQDRNL